MYPILTLNFKKPTGLMLLYITLYEFQNLQV